MTYQRLRGTLDGLLRLRAGTAATPDGRPLPGGAVLDVAFGRREPRAAASPPAWEPRNAGLDASQRGAVTLALAAEDVALVHGPPGERTAGRKSCERQEETGAVDAAQWSGGEGGRQGWGRVVGTGRVLRVRAQTVCGGEGLRVGWAGEGRVC